MKRENLSKLLVAALLAANPHAVQAENTWAMATIDEATTSFTLFHGMPEQGLNGIEYLRIYDESFKVHLTFYDPMDYAPEKLPYGYRMSDKQIFIYDFDIDKERLAFDFTLSAGEHFQTYNGVEWEIEAVIDTIVNTSYLGQGEECSFPNLNPDPKVIIIIFIKIRNILIPPCPGDLQKTIRRPCRDRRNQTEQHCQNDGKCPNTPTNFLHTVPSFFS